MALQVEKQRQINISRVRREAYFEMKTEHFHSFYEFYYLLNGKRKIFVNNRVYHVKEGDMVLIPKGEIHRTTYNSKDSHERIALCFTQESIHHLLEDIGSDTFMKCFQHKHLTIPPNRRGYLESLFDRLLHEQENEDELSQALCTRYCEEIILFIIRCQNYAQPDIPEELEDKDIEAAAVYISHHYKENITLNKMAKFSCMSDSYFSRRFKTVTGFGFKEYLNAVRIRHACDLLLSTDMSITQIASDCGYMDSNYFGDAFHKIKHVSPSQYRKTNLL